MDLSHFADTHETSVEIIEAIHFLADGNADEMARIWQDPRDEELTSIWERATLNGLITETMYWGESTLERIMEQRA